MEIWRNFPAAFSFVLMTQYEHGQAVESEAPDDAKGISFTQDVDIAPAGKNREQLKKDDQVDNAVRGSEARMRLSEPIGKHSIFRHPVQDAIGSNDGGIH